VKPTPQLGPTLTSEIDGLEGSNLETASGPENHWDPNVCVEGAVGARVNMIRYVPLYGNNPQTPSGTLSHRVSVGSSARPSKKRSSSRNNTSSLVSSETTTHREEYVNMATAGFLNLATHPDVINAGIASIEKYGVGSCGPRGFYGTLDVHLQLEEKLAQFMGYDQAVLYSSGFATIASVIPAFSKSGDYLVCDKGLSLAAQTGIKLSRSEVVWFNHNDLKDFKRALESLHEVFRKRQRRVFVVIEGLYPYYGGTVLFFCILDYLSVGSFVGDYNCRC
jgi:7-keto-8-aminopelargonate synthetase-like enzyme